MHTTTKPNPPFNITELPEAISKTLRGLQEPCTVRDLHRLLLEHYEVDYGLVLAVVVHQTACGQLLPKVQPPPLAYL